MKIIKNNFKGIKEAAEILTVNGVVAFPTETVYGLGANAFSQEAVTKVYKIKRRPTYNPLIIHVSSYQMAREYGFFNESADKLARTYWPGPLTIIVKKEKSNVVDLATAKLETIALRCPSNITARNLIGELGKPIAAPSANKSGKLTCTSPGDVFAKLKNSIDALIDGGDAELGLESTVVDCSVQSPCILRPGNITVDQINSCLGYVIAPSLQTVKQVKSPGQQLKHYSPDAKLILNQNKPNKGDIFLSFGPHPKEIDGLTLTESENLEEAAKNLFTFLHILDRLSQARGGTPIKVASIPSNGVGAAINDRLLRASEK
tara:strand:- start:1537 stop:2490 length:954 start_codon:yes stop_codon:yes gene_type:complete